MIHFNTKIFKRSNPFMHKEGYSTKLNPPPFVNEKGYAIGARDLRESVFNKINIVPINSPAMYHYKGQEKEQKVLGYAVGTKDLEKINNLDFSNYYRKI